MNIRSCHFTVAVAMHLETREVKTVNRTPSHSGLFSHTFHPCSHALLKVTWDVSRDLMSFDVLARLP